MSSNDKKNEAPAPVREFDDDVVMTFPQKMMEILSNEENSHAITWLPHGRGFIIYNKKKFASDVLPRYFKASKFTSFTRKLNRWGFSRVTQRGPEMGAYYHKFFQRDNPSLCLRMTCETSKPPPLKPDQLAMIPQVGASALPSSPLFPQAPVSTEAALIAQNTLLQQQLLLRIEHERAMSNLYMQMLQQKGIASSTPMPMVNPPVVNNALAAGAQPGPAPGTPNSSGRSSDVRKAKAA